jgi:peroxiredoxin family protein
MNEQPVSLVLFSGTDDKLQAAAVLTAGAAALGRPVRVFLQYWALDAFRANRINSRLPLAPEAGRDGEAAVERMRVGGQQSWAQTFRDAKDIGDVDIQACSLSMDVLCLSPEDLDPLVDGVEGVTAFYVNAGSGQLVFI